MGAYEDLSVGECFLTPARALDEATVNELIATGGFTLPIFTDPEFAAASGFGGIPLPGQAILLLMGGLVEQTGRFDKGVIALTGFDSVRFLKPAFAGDTLRAEVEVLSKEPTPSGAHAVLVMVWRCIKEGGERVAEATARMLVIRKERP